MELYKEYAECGFNVVLGGDAALAKQAGLKAIVGDGQVDHIALLGDHLLGGQQGRAEATDGNDAYSVPFDVEHQMPRPGARQASFDQRHLGAGVDPHLA